MPYFCWSQNPCSEMLLQLYSTGAFELQHTQYQHSRKQHVFRAKTLLSHYSFLLQQVCLAEWGPFCSISALETPSLTSLTDCSTPGRHLASTVSSRTLTTTATHTSWYPFNSKIRQQESVFCSQKNLKILTLTLQLPAPQLLNMLGQQLPNRG